MAERQTGNVSGIDRIDWNDGSTWTRVRAGSSLPVAISGRWRNSYGQPIRVEQTGNQLRATMLGSSGQRWWTSAEGRLEGDRVFIEHFHDGRRTYSQTGLRVGHDRIEWPDGTIWTRN